MTKFSTVLLCPPTFYQIEYEINPWMDVHKKADRQKTKDEYHELKKIYQKLGLRVLEIKPQPGLPDMTYVANFGFVMGNTFIKSNFKYPQRRKEAEYAQKYFKDTGFQIVSLPDDVNFECRGDIFYAEGKYYCGWGKRTDKSAINHLARILDAPVIPLQTINPYYYHLDTCFAPLGEGRVVVNPSSFTDDDLCIINKHFDTVIEASTQDNEILCCNLVVVGNTIVVGKGISNELNATFKKHGFETVEVPMKEFRKGGGSVKCLTLEFLSYNSH